MFRALEMNSVNSVSRKSKSCIQSFSLGMVLFFSGPVHGEALNISQFVFRDSNANGIYDPVDFPLNGLEVGLTPLGGERLVRVSNLNGFTNFKFSADPDDEADVKEPGPIVIDYDIPDGWRITTGKTRQTTLVKSLPNSPSGLVIDPPLEFLGVAPVPRILVAGHTSATENQASCFSAPRGTMDIKLIDLVPESNGVLSCEIPPGFEYELWSVTLISGTETGTQERTVVPGPVPTLVAMPATESEAPAIGKREASFDFDDIVPGIDIREMPSQSAALQWHNWVVAHRLYYRGPGYVNGTTSGDYVAYTSSGHPATLRSELPFDFVSANFSVAWPRAESGTAILTAHRGDLVVARQEVRLNTMAPTRVLADWRDIDRLTVSHDDYWQVVMDDVKLRLTGPSEAGEE